MTSHRRTKKSPLITRDRALLMAPFLIVAVLLAAPAFVPKSVPIDVDVTVSQIEFDTADTTIAGLFGQTFSSSVIFAGFDSVSFSTGEVRLVNPPPGLSSSLLRRFDSLPNDAQIEFNEVTLDQFGSSGSNHVRISATPVAPSHLTAIFLSPAATITFAIGESAPFSCRFCRPPSDGPMRNFSGAIAAERPQLVQIASKQGPLSVAFDCASGTSLLQADIPLTGSVKFTRPSEANPRPISTVIAEGKIEVPGFSSRDRKIQPGDFVTIAAAEGFRITSMRVDRGLKVRLSGTPAFIKIGKDSEHMESLEPSWLEWIHGRSPLLPFAEDVVLIGSAALAVLTRLKIIAEKKP
jgi:hypothetical protein